jgi:hypothetical protein
MPLQMLTTRATPKATRQAARYTPAGGAERCGMCRHFAPSSSCARIEGPVSAAGWCMLFSRQVTAPHHAGQATALGGPPGVTLDLSLMTPGTLDPRITFTRASTATYFDSSGVMQTATTNAPRWDYNPSTRALNGLLIEEARTNLSLFSADVSNAAWNKGGAILPVVTANQIAAPDGTVTAARVTLSAVNSPDFCLLAQSFTGTVASYTFSVWMRGTVGGEQVYIMLTPGGTYYKTLCVLTTTWQRFTVTSPNLTVATWYNQIGIDMRDATQTSKPAQTVYMWGAQVELGTFPTSYIPTTAASVTRAVDVATMTTAGWFTSPGGSWMAEFISMNPLVAASYRRIVTINLAASVAPIVLENTASRLGQSDGANLFTANAITVGAVAKGATTWAAGTGTACLNGGAVASGALGGGYANLTISGVRFLSNATPAEGMSGTIRRVRYWPRALTNAELQSVTT